MLTAALDTFLSIIPLIAPHVAYSHEVPDIDHIWFTETIFSSLTPQVIQTNAIIMTFVLLYLFSLVVFTICIFLPTKIRVLHIFLLFPIHLLIFHMSSSIFGYCIHFLTFYNGNLERMVFSIVFIVMYCIYFLFFTFLCYIETNSLIRPNSFYGEWFHGYTVVYPFWICLTQNVCIHTERINYFSIRITLYAINFGISIFASVAFIRAQPFLFFAMNDIQSTKTIVTALYMVFAILLNIFQESFDVILIALLPAIAILFFLIIHIFSEKRRKSHEKILHQLDDVENLSYDAIKVALSSITSQSQLFLVIKIGFTAGSPVILNFHFIRYCFEKYPTSNWLLSVIVFLYGTIWGSDPSSYKFFLHLLSIEKYHLISELLLFQNIYCFMQNSQNISPIVARHLEKYRWDNLILMQAHHDLWIQAISIGNFNDFHRLALDISYNFKRCEQSLYDVQSMFPFSPSIMFESSIFFADFKHQYLSSSKYYDKGIRLAKYGFKEVSSQLFHQFEVMFPFLIKKEEEEKVESNEYDFFSFYDLHDRAQRQSNVLYTNDQYIKTLANHFSITKELLPQNVTFFRYETFKILLVYLFMGIAMIVLYFVHLSIRNIIQDDKDHYQYFKRMMNESVYFRQHIAMTKYDFMLVLTIQSRTYEEYSRPYLREDGETPEILEDNFFWSAIDHISLAEELCSSYKYYFDKLNGTIDIDKIYAHGIEQYEYTFVPLYENYHTAAIMFVQSRSISSQNFDMLDFYRTMNSLADIAQQVYNLLANQIYNLASDSFHRHGGILIALISVDCAVIIIFSLIYQYVTRSKLKNLFSVIRTIQKPALKSVANKFNKVLIFKEHHIPTLHCNKFYLPQAYFIIVIIFLLLPPCYFLILICLFGNDPVDIPPLPELPPIATSLNYMYYSFSVVEYLISINSTIMSEYITDGIEDIFGYSPLCIHNLFDSLSDVRPFNYNFYENIDIGEGTTVNTISLVFSVIVFFIFIWSSYEMFILYSRVHLMLNFIPLQASQINPVLSQIQNGRHVSYQKMKHFSKNLRKHMKNLDFFCLLFLDEDDKVTKTIGNVHFFFKNNDISSYERIVSFIERYATHIEGIPFKQFFAERSKSIVYFSLFNDSEFSMFFNDEKQLFFKDETLNMEANQKRRVSNNLNKMSDNLKVKPVAAANNVILIVIDQIPEKRMKELKQAWMRFKEKIGRIDSRQYRYICVINIANIENKNEDIQALADFLFSISKIIAKCRIGIDYGGPIQIFDLSRNLLAKTRIAGFMYDRLLLLTSFAPAGKIWVTKEFLQLVNRENEYKYTDFPITDTETVHAASIAIDNIEEFLHTG